MVVFADLDDAEADSPDAPNGGTTARLPFRYHIDDTAHVVSVAVEIPNPNIDSVFSASLSCYPIVSALASHIDLNTLHALSLTCRQFRANLLQFRSQLIKTTLKCINEEQTLGPKLGDRFRESMQAWSGIGANGRRYNGNNRDRITSGRVGRCARDLVGECRRCGVVVCRNCTIKPPSDRALEGRHRRLCRTCMKAPLSNHLTPPTHDPEPLAATPMLDADTDPFMTPRRASTPTSPSTTTLTQPEPQAFTHPAFARTPCTCAAIVYLCNSCGSAMRTADLTYARGWTWRTRYSTYLGGLGTGIGEGNEGVACGRGAFCLSSREVEQEVDADAAELARMEAKIGDGKGREWGGTSFFTQEIEGIGGVVKRKVKRRVRVGAVVKEYEDEREGDEFLGREKRGGNRSWCAWCERVVVGVKDRGVGAGVERKVGGVC